MMITRTLSAEMQASFEELGFSCSRMDTSQPTSESESCRALVHMMITRTLTAEMQASFEELGFSCSSPR
jgi:hypothetical protein